jgi:hypothetical protein
MIERSTTQTAGSASLYRDWSVSNPDTLRRPLLQIVDRDFSLRSVWCSSMVAAR